MNYDLLIGGIAILVFALIATFARNLGIIRIIPSTFSIMWSSLVALHFWGFAYNQLIELGLISGMRLNLIASFWIVFIVAFIPYFFLVKISKNIQASSLPTLAGKIMIPVCSVTIAATIALLIAMSFSIGSRESLTADTKIAQLQRKIQFIPINCYMKVSKQKKNSSKCFSMNIYNNLVTQSKNIKKEESKTP